VQAFITNTAELRVQHCNARQLKWHCGM